MSSGYKPRKWVKPATPPNSEINVTPLVDVVLVLLIIFMVVTPLMEKDFEVRIPEVEKQEVQVEEPDPNQLVVKLNKDGDITINTEAVAGDEFVKRLKRMLAAKKKEDRIVFFVADDQTNYGKLVAAFDGAKRAGAFVLGMATEDIPEAIAAPSPEGGTVVEPVPAPSP